MPILVHATHSDIPGSCQVQEGCNCGLPFAGCVVAAASAAAAPLPLRLLLLRPLLLLLKLWHVDAICF